MRSAWLFFIFLPALDSFQKKLPSTKKYVIRQLNIKCFNIDTTRIQFDRCELKSKRGTNGLINIVVHYNGIADIKIETKLFYRGTSGRYQPFIINVEFDLCHFVDAAVSNKIIKTALEVIAVKFDKTIVEGCPLKGPFNVTNWDPEEDFDSIVFVKVLPGKVDILSYFKRKLLP